MSVSAEKIKEAQVLCESLNEINSLIEDYSDSEIKYEHKDFVNNYNGLFSQKRLEKDISVFYNELTEKQLFLINEQQKILRLLDDEIYQLENKKQLLNSKLEKIEIILEKITIKFSDINNNSK